MFLIFVFHDAFCMGAKEDSLVTADTLIEQKKYNEAFIVVKDFMQKNPERFDEGQQRLQKIIFIREKFNQTAGSLLDIIVSDPENNKLKLEKIAQLAALESNPNKETKDFIQKYKETALFTYNKARYDEILRSGAASIAAGKYSDAIRIYRGGFVLYKPEFDEAGYDDRLVSAVKDGLSAIEKTGEKFASIEANFLSISTEYAKALKTGDNALVVKSANAWDIASRELLGLRHRVALEGRSFEREFIGLKLETENHFLPFSFRFTVGRKTAEKHEGILGAIDTEWFVALKDVRAAAAERSAASRIALAKKFENREFGNLPAFAEKARTDAIYALALESIASEYVRGEMVPVPTKFAAEALSAIIPATLEYQNLLASLDRYDAAMALIKESENQNTALEDYLASSEAKPAALKDALGFFRDREIRFLTAGESLGKIKTQAEGAKGTLVRKAASSWYRDDAAEYDSAFSASLSAEITLVERYRKRSIAESLGVEYGDALAKFTTDKKRSEEAVALSQGRVSRETDTFGLILKYPDESAQSLEALEPELNSLGSALSAIIAVNKAKLGNTEYDIPIRDLIGKAETLKSELDNLLIANIATKTKAKEQKLLADSYRLEAERRLEEARAQLRKENFEQAKLLLSRSSERYNLSLSIQENPKTRSDADRILAGFSNEIVSTERQKVTTEVTRLVKASKDYYYQGSFDLAEESLLQGQTRWRTVFPTQDDPELLNWLGIVRQAISIKTGRDIPVTAPLYREMSQMASQAKQRFEEGRKFMEANNRTDALRVFAESKTLIQQVKVVFPLNQEMSVLELKIDQIADRDNFQKTFDAKVRQAYAKRDAGNQKEAYTDLSDLQAINPGYPGLKANVLELEYFLGLKNRPPDPLKLAQSEKLTDQAARIIAAADKINYPVALAQLNQALILNPNNERASSYKVRVQNDTGDTAILVMTGADEAAYQRAIQLFQQGDKILADALVEQLWKKAANQKVPKLIDLRTRIKASL